MQNHPQKEFMMKAIEEAKNSASLCQYTIGAIIVDSNGEILAVEHTSTHSSNDATAHAEISAIRSVCKKLNNRYLFGCWLYTTLEPCPMCISAAIWSKIDGVVFGATKEDAIDFSKGIESSKFKWRQIDISAKDIVAKGDPHINLVEGFMRDECKPLFSFEKNTV